MKTLFLSIFLLICSICNAQKFQATQIAVRVYNDSTHVFYDWSEWHQSDVIITLSDTNIHIYSNMDQDYTIISIIGNKLFQNAKVMAFDVIDINNSRCTIEVLHYDNGINQLYIRWPNLQLAYQFKKL